MVNLKNARLKQNKQPKKDVVELFVGINKRYYFHVKSSNNKTTTSSQGYSTKSNAKRAAKKLFPDLEIVSLEKSILLMYPNESDLIKQFKTIPFKVSGRRLVPNK